MNREILKSMDTGHIPVQRLTALLETFTLKHAARMLPDLLETADLQDSSCREFLLAVLETEVKGRNERRRKRNYSAAHFPPNIRPLEEFDPEELGVRYHPGTALRLERTVLAGQLRKPCLCGASGPRQDHGCLWSWSTGCQQRLYCMF